jgi:hypothetical protein
MIKHPHMETVVEENFWVKNKNKMLSVNHNSISRRILFI